MIKPEILYEDGELIVVKKPAGVDSQESRGSLPDMVSLLKKHLVAVPAEARANKLSTELSTQGGGRQTAPYIAVVHRLDRQVSGVMVYAKTKSAAAALSKQVQDGRMEKTYLAVLCGKPVDSGGTCVDYLWKNGKTNTSEVVDKSHPDSRRAELTWELLAAADEDRLSGADAGGAAGEDRPSGADTGSTAGAKHPEDNIISLVRIHLKTGRHHQIRVQFSTRGLPLYGDVKYNPAFSGKRSEGPALCAAELSFVHPKTGKQMIFSVIPEHEAFQAFPMMQALQKPGAPGEKDCR